MMSHIDEAMGSIYQQKKKAKQKCVPSLGLEPATKGVCSAAACMLTTTPSERGERKGENRGTYIQR
jgi:hypothetical protein